VHHAKAANATNLENQVNVEHLPEKHVDHCFGEGEPQDMTAHNAEPEGLHVLAVGAVLTVVIARRSHQAEVHHMVRA
jgi:hypothetical protein